MSQSLTSEAPAGPARWTTHETNTIKQTNNVRVLEPESVAGVYSSATADFGVPLYGFKLFGEAFYPEAKQNQLGCEYEAGFKVRNERNGKL